MIFRSKNLKNAFTLVEVAAGIVILSLITGSLVVSLNRYMQTATGHDLRMQAFSMARERMEQLLSMDAVSDFSVLEYSELYPDIELETTVESFYEPLTSRMWTRAVCTARYYDDQDVEKEVSLTHWLTDLSKKQIRQVMEQQKRQREYEAAMAEFEEGPLPEEFEPDTPDGPGPDDRTEPPPAQQETYCGKTMDELMQMPFNEIFQFLFECDEF